MFGFDIKQDKLKKDKNFKGSIWERLQYSKYLCPKCNTHLRESTGELICLNGCHLPDHWRKRFNNQLKEISKNMEANK